MNLRGHGRNAGFTLVEMMVAMVVGGISVMVAMQIAQVVIRQSAKGRQRTDFSERTGLLSRQLRADLRAAGVGSTGAIAVPAETLFNDLAVTTEGGFRAMAAIAGADNVGALVVGAETILDGSDVIQLVVPNPATLRRTFERSPEGGTQLIFEDGVSAGAFDGCEFVYVTDHSAPNGAGRTQIARRTGTVGQALTTGAALPFTVAPGSDVMCARISSYWVDSNGWFHRSDLRSGGSPITVAGAPIVIESNPAQSDRVAPGILQLQVAYRMSSEAFRVAGAATPAAVDERWAFRTDASPLNGPTMANPQVWFEVRLVRLNLLARTLRKIQASESERTVAVMENSPPITGASFAHVVDWMTFTEPVTNLRFFDMIAPQGLAAEPY